MALHYSNQKASRTWPYKARYFDNSHQNSSEKQDYCQHLHPQANQIHRPLQYLHLTEWRGCHCPHRKEPPVPMVSIPSEYQVRIKSCQLVHFGHHENERCQPSKQEINPMVHFGHHENKTWYGSTTFFFLENISTDWTGIATRTVLFEILHVLLQTSKTFPSSLWLRLMCCSMYQTCFPQMLHLTEVFSSLRPPWCFSRCFFNPT